MFVLIFRELGIRIGGSELFDEANYAIRSGEEELALAIKSTTFVMLHSS